MLILVCTQANGDIKLITNDPETKAASWYLVGYINKGHGHNASMHKHTWIRAALAYIIEIWDSMQ